MKAATIYDVAREAGVSHQADLPRLVELIAALERDGTAFRVTTRSQG